MEDTPPLLKFPPFDSLLEEVWEREDITVFYKSNIITTRYVFLSMIPIGAMLDNLSFNPVGAVINGRRMNGNALSPGSRLVRFDL